MATKQNGGGLKWVIIVCAIIAVAAGGIWYYKHGNNNALQYETTPVARGDLTQVVTATGTLNPVLNVTVGSQVSGRITKLNVDFNSVVTSNEVIAEIDPSTYEAQLESGRGQSGQCEGQPGVAGGQPATGGKIIHQQFDRGSRLRHGRRHAGRGGGAGANSSRPRSPTRSPIWATANSFAGGRRGDFARGGFGTDGRLQFQHADPVSNRERPDEDAD